ncbi:MAG: hypothetical protein AAGC78_08585 [Cellvibrio sp.]|uniref:hypothetical protein n=1 Tax=Cellvibrio sp. TaxID=1965322 RepID=UPI0031B03E4E
MHAQLTASEDQQLILDAWVQAIQSGNQAFSSGNNKKARVSYQTALRVVRSMVKSTDGWGYAIPEHQVDAIMAALVVSQHNLADLYVHAGLLGRAAEHLCAAHQAIFDLLRHPVDSVAELAQRHLNMTRMELMTFLQSYGDYPLISQTLCATQMPFPRNSPLTH